VSEERGDAIYFNEQQESKTTRHQAKHLGRNSIILCMKHEYYIYFFMLFILHMSVTENNQKDREPIKIFTYYNNGQRCCEVKSR
jgi:hypothetical protein